MRIAVVAVGRARGHLADALREYEARTARYFTFQAHEVREEPARQGNPVARVRDEEGKRLLARVPDGWQVIALHREGRGWSSEQLAEHLGQAGLHGGPGAAFLIGGAFGLSPAVLARADHLLSLSAFTMPHEMARLVLTEQLYRAGTILRGEPYHKTRGE